MKRQRKVELLPQLIEAMVSDEADVYLMFVDLCGSTLYKQNLIKKGTPDLTWIFRQLIFLQRTSDIIKQYSGIIVKTIGDEIFAYFDVSTNPLNILKCAIEIIQSFENLKSYRGNSKIEAKASIDVGLTYNGAIVDYVPYDPIGSAVDRCARLNSVCKNNEIVLSVDFFSAITAKTSDLAFKKKYNYSSRYSNLKGFGRTKLYAISAK